MEKLERKTRQGVVVSDAMEKTVVVAVETPKRHPIYHKNIKHTKKYYAHDEKDECKVGDTVLIEETRPMSKLKRWRVREIITKGQVADIKPSEITT